MDGAAYNAPALCRAEIELAQRPNLVRYYKWRGRWMRFKSYIQSNPFRPLRIHIKIEGYFGYTAQKKKVKYDQLVKEVDSLTWRLKHLEDHMGRR